MDKTDHEIIQPKEFKSPKGYANGILAKGKTLFVGGQIGWDQNHQFQSGLFLEQFDQALAHVVSVVGAASGKPSHITSMTIYVTDLDEYRSSTKRLGPVWQKHMGKHYPAMALLGVSGLVESQAKIEIQAIAVIPSI